MDGLRKDFAHAARALRGRPAFTTAAVLTLALGIGATTAMFSTVHAVLLRALPYEPEERIVVLRQVDTRDGSVADGLSAANVRDLAEAARSLSHVAGAEAHGLRLLEDGRATSLRAWLVTNGFFEVLGVRPILGRTFGPDEFVAGSERVVLLSHRTWQDRFGADPRVVDRELILDGAAHAVVGVLPPGFRYPSEADVWGPRPAQPWDDAQRSRAGLDAVARLEPGTTTAAAGAELDRIARDLVETHPEANANLGIEMRPLREHLLGHVQSPLQLLMGAVLLVLLISAANVAGLQLARGAGRSREYALRGALGASSLRILRLVTIESSLLAVLGGALGVFVAYAGVESIRLVGPDHLPRLDEIAIDGTVLWFAVLAALVSAVISGLAPALRASRVDLHAALAAGPRGTTLGGAHGRLRDRIVVLEIGLAVILTVGAGLLIRSFDRLLENELGFDPEGRLAVQVWAYDDDHGTRLDYFDRARHEIEGVRGVQAVGLTTDLPLADDRSLLARPLSARFVIDGRAVAEGGAASFTRLSAIDPTYVEALGVPLVEGRAFSSRDDSTTALVALINVAFARRYLSGVDAIGQQVTLYWRSGASRRIVGVLGDMRRGGFEAPAVPEVFVPLAQEPANGLTFVVKTSGPAAAATVAVQEAMWSADPSQATWAMRPMTELLGDWVRQRRFNTLLLLAFATFALVLAGIGIYGVVSFSVEQRSNEMGIRRALGGDTGKILATVLGRGMALGLVGTGLGLIGAVGLARLIRGLLFGIEPLDPLTFVVVSAFVIGVAALASFLPARRATRVDPTVALRIE